MPTVIVAVGFRLPFSDLRNRNFPGDAGRCGWLREATHLEPDAVLVDRIALPILRGGDFDGERFSPSRASVVRSSAFQRCSLKNRIVSFMIS